MWNIRKVMNERFRVVDNDDGFEDEHKMFISHD